MLSHRWHQGWLLIFKLLLRSVSRQWLLLLLMEILILLSWYCHCHLLWHNFNSS
ncbi:hypothetical protein Taro_003278, partial [Colocasia esculenta]|nr:hypothetical protein [Colocasia esculenta]